LLRHAHAQEGSILLFSLKVSGQSLGFLKEQTDQVSIGLKGGVSGEEEGQHQ